MWPTYIDLYHGVRVYESAHLGTGYDCGGIALPGFGIIVGRGAYSQNCDMGLLQHEYGHILQARHIGTFLFYVLIGIPSLISAWTHWHGRPHQWYWTERWANHLSTQYFAEFRYQVYRFPPRDISAKTKKWLMIRET